MQTVDTISDIINANYSQDQYPVCYEQAQSWQKRLPLKGLTLLDATPIFQNTLVKYKALIDAGAKLIVGTTNIIAHDRAVVEMLVQNGIQVVHCDDPQMEVDIIMDCAASYSHWQPRIGFVELTRSGVEMFRHANKPVFVADSGSIKKIETCLGTGESYFRAMKQLGYDQWNNRKLILFGSGKVGTGILTHAFRLGVNVTVITKLDSVTEQIKVLATQIIDHKDTQKVVEALKDAYAVVTATGIENALEGNCPAKALIDSPALLANMGAKEEFGPSIPTQRVLNHKKTLNFILTEPTHLKYIDATMALHNEGALYIANNPQASGLIDPPAQIEEKLLKICRENGCITKELEWI